MACAVLAAWTADAAPLEPFDTNITCQISGSADLNGPGAPQPATYNFSGSATEFTEGGMMLRSHVCTGGTPEITHAAWAGSYADIAFEQIASNEYVLTLSTTAWGQVYRADSPAFVEGTFWSETGLELLSSFRILGLPGQQPGAPASILVGLEDSGSLSEANNSRSDPPAAAHTVNVEIGGSFPGVQYARQIETPPPPPLSDFQGHEFTGVRYVAQPYSFAAKVGDTFQISIQMKSRVDGEMLSSDVSQMMTAESSFFEGMRLHLTVLPEPTGFLVFALGGLAVLRKRR